MFVIMNVLITLEVVLTLAIFGTADDQRVVLSNNTRYKTETKLDNHASDESVLNKNDGNDTEFTPLMLVLDEIRSTCIGLLNLSADIDQFNISREYSLIIEIQQRACPNNIPLCPSNVTSYYYTFYCCRRRCNCNLTECMAERNCCPDVIISTYGGLPTERQEQCIPMTTDGLSTGDFGYYGVDSCPLVTDGNLASRCTKMYTKDAIEHLSDLVPCFDEINQTLHMNIFCAICNGIFEKDISYLESDAKFISSFADFTITETPPGMVREENICHIQANGCDRNTGLCYSAVDCNMSGPSCENVGSTYKEMVCHGYTNFSESYIKEYSGYFKDIFCNVTQVPEVQSCIKLGFLRTIAYSSVVRLHFSPHTQVESVPQVSRHLFILLYLKDAILYKYHRFTFCITLFNYNEAVNPTTLEITKI